MDNKKRPHNLFEKISADLKFATKLEDIIKEWEETGDSSKFIGVLVDMNRAINKVRERRSKN
jgi:hypothetical protein